MAAGNRLSDADALQVLNEITRAVAPTWPADFYFALVTTAPTDDTGAGIVEVTGGAYARVAKIRGTTDFTAAASAAGVRSSGNTADVQWPTATADWAAGATKVVGIAIYDAATSGTYRGYTALTTAVNVLTGGAPKVAAGNLTFVA